MDIIKDVQKLVIVVMNDMNFINNYSPENGRRRHLGRIWEVRSSRGLGLQTESGVRIALTSPHCCRDWVDCRRQLEVTKV
ncbi:unnamed protein product [Amoebophrya sp. A25]|nr:unnamed protein product [Amoebophrya sp. A25]|eukprot:GSA25T00003179001.1